MTQDWYDLRDCLAGCIGGMMSIGLTSMKLHMKIVDGQRFRYDDQAQVRAVLTLPQ